MAGGGLPASVPTTRIRGWLRLMDDFIALLARAQDAGWISLYLQSDPFSRYALAEPADRARAVLPRPPDRSRRFALPGHWPQRICSRLPAAPPTGSWRIFRERAGHSPPAMKRSRLLYSGCMGSSRGIPAYLNLARQFIEQRGRIPRFVLSLSIARISAWASAANTFSRRRQEYLDAHPEVHILPAATRK